MIQKTNDFVLAHAYVCSPPFFIYSVRDIRTKVHIETYPPSKAKEGDQLVVRKWGRALGGFWSFSHL